MYKVGKHTSDEYGQTRKETAEMIRKDLKHDHEKMVKDVTIQMNKNVTIKSIQHR